MTPYYADGQTTLYHGDALAILPMLPTASVQLLIIDPPYHKVKMTYEGQRVEWDRQWPTREAYLSWLRQLAKEWQRVLTPNGSLYCFASPDLAAWVEVTLSEVFEVIQRVTWRKPPFSTKAEMFDKSHLRMFFPASEAILFCEQRHSDSLALGESGYAAQCEHLHGHVFEPIRAYLDGERQRAGISRRAINAACGVGTGGGGMANHYFSPGQWGLPIQEHYHRIRHLLNTQGRRPAPPFTDYHPGGSPFAQWHASQADYEYLRADYEALRADYEALRADYEALRRPFTVHATIPYTDVWDFATVPYQPGKHPCEKPLPLLRHMIQCSSRPGDTVLDCCAGGGSTLEAAKQCGRMGIGIELEARWCALAVSRVRQETLFPQY